MGVNARPRPLYLREKDLVPILQEAGWAPGQSGQIRKTSPPLGFDPRTFQHVASRYTDYAIPAHNVTIVHQIIIDRFLPYPCLFIISSSTQNSKLHRQIAHISFKSVMLLQITLTATQYYRWFYILHAVVFRNGCWQEGNWMLDNPVVQQYLAATFCTPLLFTFKTNTRVFLHPGWHRTTPEENKGYFVEWDK